MCEECRKFTSSGFNGVAFKAPRLSGLVKFLAEINNTNLRERRATRVWRIISSEEKRRIPGNTSLQILAREKGKEQVVLELS